MKIDVNIGTEFLLILQIAFIILKLIGVIHWSWLWVLSPIWIPIVFILLLVVIAILW